MVWSCFVAHVIIRIINACGALHTVAVGSPAYIKYNAVCADVTVQGFS